MSDRDTVELEGDGTRVRLEGPPAGIAAAILELEKKEFIPPLERRRITHLDCVGTNTCKACVETQQ